jgi:glutaredoxin
MTRRIQGLLAAAAFVMAAPAMAQYKYVGPDGRITYSDRPAPTSERIVSQHKLNEATALPTPLPFEVQQATSKYPVTLYSGERCPPCDDARTYLRNRGVPYTEKTVTSDDDIALFKALSPDGSAPVVAVGNRKAVGYAQTTVSALLDAAGYPQAAQLPRDFQNPAPTPLSPNTRTAAQNVAAPAAAPTPARNGPAAAANTPPPAPASPPGFRF